MITEHSAKLILLKYVEGFPTQKAAAISLRITQQYLNDVIKTRSYRNVPDRILEGMGYRRVTMVQRIPNKKKRKAAKARPRVSEPARLVIETSPSEHAGF